MANQAVGFVALTLEFRREGKVCVGVCRELGTSTYARTLPWVNEELREMVILHLNALEQEGECDHFFETHGIKFYTDRPTNVSAQLNSPPSCSTKFPITGSATG